MGTVKDSRLNQPINAYAKKLSIDQDNLPWQSRFLFAYLGLFTRAVRSASEVNGGREEGFTPTRFIVLAAKVDDTLVKEPFIVLHYSPSQQHDKNLFLREMTGIRK